MIEGLFQPTHLLLIMVLALMLFGSGKLSQTGAALGKSVGEFRRAVREPDSVPTAPRRVCSTCGVTAGASDRFCPSCGTSLRVYEAQANPSADGQSLK